jgi:hypothetical protein
MRTRFGLVIALPCLAIATGWLTGCKSHSATAAPTGPTSLPTTVASLTISGSGTLTSPGQTSQLIAEATYSDGSRKDVTATAQWFSSNRNVATVSPGGLVTAVDFGKTNVTASVPNRPSVVRVVTVLPEGTYILSGRVTEAGSFPVPDARIEIVGGPMNGRAVSTNQSGMYAFNGVAGVSQVRATKNGYVPSTEPVSQDTENTNLELTPGIPYASIGGIYRLKFTASGTCQLPDDAVSREYTATINQVSPGAMLTVTLSDAEFGTYFNQRWNSFTGRVLGNTVTFTLNDGYDALYYGGVAEKLGDARYLMLTGTANATVTGPSISARLAGSVRLISSPSDIWGPSIACAAPDHQLGFTPNGAAARHAVSR